MPWLSILLGFWVAAMRPRDAHAWLVLGILLGLSQIIRPPELDPRGWPSAIGPTAVAFRELASAAWPICMMLFGVYFPKRWIVDRRVPWIKWLFIVPLAAHGFYSAASSVAASVDWNLGQWPDVIPQGILTALSMSATGVFFMALASKYPDPALAHDERRRLKVLYWGSTVAMGPTFLLILYSLVMRRNFGDNHLLVYSIMLMALFPVTMAYVIVVGRALDVRMIVRTGVQYTLARGGIRIIQACLVIAVIFFAVEYSGQGPRLPSQVIHADCDCSGAGDPHTHPGRAPSPLGGPAFLPRGLQFRADPERIERTRALHSGYSSSCWKPWRARSPNPCTCSMWP